MHKLCDTPGDPEAALRRQLEGVAGAGAVYVIGLGNADRADDGAGVLVAEALKTRHPDRVFSEHDGVEGVVLDIADREGDAIVLFVDAANMDGAPGEVRVVERDGLRETEVTTHRVAVALMASLLERAGKRSAVVCIKPQTVEFRGNLSEPVRRSVELVTRVLEEMIR